MPSAESTELFIALGAVVKRIRNRPLPEHASLAGVPFAPRHVSTLLQIAQAAPVGMSELAQQMNVSLATMSQVVTDLEEWGLVERASDPADRRRTLVSIATAYRPAIRVIQDQRLRPLDRALRRLEPDERAGLIRGLTVLAEELDRMDKQTPAGKDLPSVKETTSRETSR
jgi:DNA-binding MarR family transcriptional regulator